MNFAALRFPAERHEIRHHADITEFGRPSIRFWTISKRKNVQQIVCLGDVVATMPNPRMSRHDRAMNIPSSRQSRRILFQRRSSRGLIRTPPEAVIWTRNQLTVDERQWLRDLILPHVANFTIVHATLDAPHAWGTFLTSSPPPRVSLSEHADVFLRPHACARSFHARHRRPRRDLFQFKIDPAKKYFINVGAAASLATNNPRTGYVVYDMDAARSSSPPRLRNIATTQKKIRDAGLPDGWPERLELAVIFARSSVAWKLICEIRVICG